MFFLVETQQIGTEFAVSVPAFSDVEGRADSFDVAKDTCRTKVIGELERHLRAKVIPPLPEIGSAPAGREYIEVPWDLAARLSVLVARLSEKLSIEDVAARIDEDADAVAHLENPQDPLALDVWYKAATLLEAAIDTDVIAAVRYAVSASRSSHSILSDVLPHATASIAGAALSRMREYAVITRLQAERLWDHWDAQNRMMKSLTPDDMRAPKEQFTGDLHLFFIAYCQAGRLASFVSEAIRFEAVKEVLDRHLAALRHYCQGAEIFHHYDQYIVGAWNKAVASAQQTGTMMVNFGGVISASRTFEADGCLWSFDYPAVRLLQNAIEEIDLTIKRECWLRFVDHHRHRFRSMGAGATDPGVPPSGPPSQALESP